MKGRIIILSKKKKKKKEKITSPRDALVYKPIFTCTYFIIYFTFSLQIGFNTR